MENGYIIEKRLPKLEADLGFVAQSMVDYQKEQEAEAKRLLDKLTRETLV